VKAEIIPIGTEILLGNIVETNSSFLANELASLGIDLYFVSTVGDNRRRIIDTIQRAWTRADLVITTGGLGPTQGDITRETIAEFLGEEASVDLGLWQELQERLRHFYSEIPQSNAKQATVIPSARVIPNPIGTAPGWWIEKDNHILVTMPGPPHEMQLMWTERVLPKLHQKVTGTIILSRTLKTLGAGESKVDELLAPFLPMANPTLATYAKPDGIHLRITAKGADEARTTQMLAEREADIREILDPYVWGKDDDTLESTVGELLRTNGWSLAVMESWTDGLLSNAVASNPESRASFKGGLIAFSDEAKVALGIDARILEYYGSESAEVAEAMAEQARTSLRADFAIGVAGTESASEETTQVFITVASDRLKQAAARTFLGDTRRTKQRTVYAALFELRRMLLQEVQCT
jgi:nicotinamide-nucleotide amidase